MGLNAAGLDTNATLASFSEAMLYYSLFTAMLAMGAFFVFFLTEKEHIVKEYRGTMSTSAMIVGVAAVAYYFLAKSYDPNRPFPIALRYFDWTITTPLLVLKFQEMLKVRGAAFTAKLIVADLFMIVTGFIGELYGTTTHGHWTANTPNGVTMHYVWGAISTLGYLYIVYAVLTTGRALIPNLPKHIGSGVQTMTKYILIGWGVYPIVYILEGLSASHPEWNINLDWANVVSSVSDVVNKVVFGITVYLAVRAYSGDALYDPKRNLPPGENDTPAMRRDANRTQVPGNPAENEVVRPSDGVQAQA